MATRSTLELAGAPHASATGTGEITFIGTATTLIRVGGFTILTDPNFLRRGERAYVGIGLSTKRLTDPAMSIDQLPPIDFVVLSHHHGDHFDRVAASKLDKNLPIITEPHAAKKLRSQGFRRPIALSNWESQTVTRGGASVQVTSMPGKHAPEPLGYVLPPVMGTMLDFFRADERVLRLYITGDTLLHDGLHDIARRYPDIDLCLIHLGGTRVLGILLTMDGRQGVEALRIVAPSTAVPIHYDDYTLFKSPLSDFRREIDRATDLSTAIHYVNRGDTYTFELPSGRPVGGG